MGPESQALDSVPEPPNEREQPDPNSDER